MIPNNKKAVIHIAKAQTGMAEDEYRSLLSSVGVETSKDLTPQKFKIVMKHFEKLGFKKKKKKRKSIESKVLLLGKVTALCFAMDLSAGYADGIAKRMFKVDKLQWCSADQLRKVVAALVYKKRKTGNSELGMGNEERKIKNGELGTGNGERKTRERE